MGDNREKVAEGEEGTLEIKNPWPGMALTIYKETEILKHIWKIKKDKDLYKAGGSARKDKDEYIWIIERIDDVIKVSGYRLGSAEIEIALVSHDDVSAAAAFTLPYELKRNSIQYLCNIESRR